jgi:hypothetical protein
LLQVQVLFTIEQSRSGLRGANSGHFLIGKQVHDSIAQQVFLSLFVVHGWVANHSILRLLQAQVDQPSTQLVIDILSGR